MTEGSKRTRKNQASKVSKSNPPLPWWVEVLFVQVGLPDSWLRSLLKTKKKTLNYIDENRNSVLIAIFILFTLLYVEPLIKKARQENKCFEEASIIIKKQGLKSTTIDNNLINAMANRFCNGGGINFEIEQ